MSDHTGSIPHTSSSNVSICLDLHGSKQVTAMCDLQDVHRLAERYSIISSRLDAVERTARQNFTLALSLRWAALEARLAALVTKAGLQEATSCEATPCSSQPVHPQEPVITVDPEPPADASPTQQRLHRELVRRGFTEFRFVRVPGGYYEQPLEWRQAQLGAASTDHLCKSIVAENTRAHPSAVHPTDPLHPDNWANPRNSRYYVIIVQYSARLNFEKLKTLIHRLNDGKIGKQFFNIRLAPEDINDALTGYQHNAVSPVGMPVELPMIMSHRITELTPDFFFVGGGEVDLKLGFCAREFLANYASGPGVLVADITY